MATTPELQQRNEAVIVGDRVEVIVKSRARIKAYGEVFTPQHMVNRMLDLVKEELETGAGFVDKTFFEPAAGDGNFLIAILRRKLAAIAKDYPLAVRADESLFALASIYGVELLEDNLQAAKAAMLGEFVKFHENNGIACSPQTDLFRAADYLISTNILQGNTLTGLDPKGDPITFSWWHRVPGETAIVQREAFTLASLRHENEGTLNFDIHPSYAPSRIDSVYKEARADV
ncbi:hypothetical protein [Corynebacterium frankenforstense]|uniref:hypothetical protein n=1 Tax=Corynebacterium frankenforstense TaxID=1230998 RepID=UPI002608C013|nr:hypothetical protein [Corynebacterium frankenforstense]